MIEVLFTRHAAVGFDVDKMWDQIDDEAAKNIVPADEFGETPAEQEAAAMMEERFPSAMPEGFFDE